LLTVISLKVNFWSFIFSSVILLIVMASSVGHQLIIVLNHILFVYRWLSWESYQMPRRLQMKVQLFNLRLKIEVFESDFSQHKFCGLNYVHITTANNAFKVTKWWS
jgi:hypothetical protein